MTDETSFDYEQAIWGREMVRPGDRTVAGYAVAELLRALPSRGRVLEWGCGAGRHLGAVHAARPGLELAGMDVSRTALEIAEGRLPGVAWRRCEAGAPLPAADGEFDAAFVMDALEHVDDPAAALAELHRVVRPGGTLHLHVPCEGDALSLWRWLPPPARWWKRELGGHLARFRREDVTHLLLAAGFEPGRTRFSLHVLGNVADVGAFAVLALARRFRPERALTTGDLLAQAHEKEAPPPGRGGAWLGVLTRLVDALLWWEARLLGRWPAWGLHVSARRADTPPAA